MSPLARTDELVGYRQSNWDTPWAASSNLREGRYHRPFEEATQYLCLHPLGVAAELLRHLGRDVIDDLDTVHYRLWAARVPREGLVRIQFQTAEAHGIAAEDLVGDAYGPTQSLADRLRGDGVPGAIVPSAALPAPKTWSCSGPASARPTWSTRPTLRIRSPPRTPASAAIPRDARLRSCGGSAMPTPA